MRYVRITDIDEHGQLRPDGFSEPEGENLDEYVLDDGDLLLARSGATVGKSYRHVAANGRCVFAGYLIRFRPNPALVDSRYLSYFLQTQTYWNWVQSRKRVAAQPNINGTEYGSLGVPLAPLSEQHRIVEILNEADRLCKLRREADAKVARMLPTLFRKLLGDPAMNPMGWPLRTGKQLFKVVRYGVGTPPPFAASGIPFLRATNLKPQGINRRNLAFFNPVDADTIARSKVRQGDVVIVRRGANTGDCVVIPKEFDGAYVGYDLICEPAADTNCTWFAAAWNYPSVWQSINALRTRAAQQGLNKEQIESFVLPTPPKLEQDVFADQAEKVTNVISVAKGATEKLASLFFTLLHHAFSSQLTARWREGHFGDLLAEMEQQANLLNLPRPSIARLDAED